METNVVKDCKVLDKDKRYRRKQHEMKETTIQDGELIFYQNRIHDVMEKAEAVEESLYASEDDKCYTNNFRIVRESFDEIYKDVPFLFLWAKKANPSSGSVEKNLLTHMLETAWTCQSLLRHTAFHSYLNWLTEITSLCEEDCIRTISFFVGLHDIGKCHPYFQIRYPESENIQYLLKNNYFRSSEKYTEKNQKDFRHEYYGGDVLANFLKKDNWNSDVVDIIKKVTHMHHQHVTCYKGFLPAKDKDVWNKMQTDLYHYFSDLFCPVHFQIEEQNIDVFFMFLSGIEMYSDWIASGDIFKDVNFLFNHPQAEMIYKKECQQRLNAYIKNYHLSVKNIFSDCNQMKDILPFTKNWTLHPVQQLAEEIMKNVNSSLDCVVIESEMGCGKTEIAEYMALYMMQKGLTDKSGIYMALPTESTSVSMQPRFLDMLSKTGYVENENIPLFTGNAFIYHHLKQYQVGNTDNSSDNICIKDSPILPSDLKFLHPWAVGTVDQSMKYYTLMKHGILGIDAINTKILIIDEMHAYDAYMFEILETELKWAKAFHTPVIILSATLPQTLKRKIFDVFIPDEYVLKNNYPLISVCQNGCLNQYTTKEKAKDKTYFIKTEKWLKEPEKITEYALKKIKNGGCMSIIMNTVKSARNVYDVLKNQMDDSDIEILFFHGQMPIAPKEKMAKKIVKLFGKDRTYRPKKAIVVSTQILEQSIDVDFDYMMTAICPIDLLFQRLGRECRHSDNGTVREGKKWYLECVVLYDTEDCSAVYPYLQSAILLQRTLKILQDKHQLNIPSDIRPCIDKVYEENEELRSYICANQQDANAADAHTIDGPNLYGEIKLYENRGKLSRYHMVTRKSDMIRYNIAFLHQKDMNLCTDKVPVKDYIRIKTENVISVPYYTVKKMNLEIDSLPHIFGDIALYNVDSGDWELDENYCLVEKEKMCI